MRDNHISSWKHLITLTSAVLFGLSIFIAPAAMADKKVKDRGHSKVWKKEKELEREERKKYEEMEREDRKRYEEDERESRKYDEEQERESRKYDREQ
ncbi:MAG: hypothetical protein PVG35_13935 [Desulfobacterales bacterium]|jgi:hypothetical protein